MLEPQLKNGKKNPKIQNSIVKVKRWAHYRADFDRYVSPCACQELLWIYRIDHKCHRTTMNYLTDYYHYCCCYLLSVLSSSYAFSQYLSVYFWLVAHFFCCSIAAVTFYIVEVIIIIIRLRVEVIRELIIINFWFI